VKIDVFVGNVKMEEINGRIGLEPETAD